MKELKRKTKLQLIKLENSVKFQGENETIGIKLSIEITEKHN